MADAASEGRPNVVLIMSDQHNAQVMGCAGDPVVQTPNLDRLAAEGVRFANTYCPSPLCAPSRMGYLTAQYPSDVGVWNNGSALCSDEPTFAHALGASGVEAVLCGRMHFNGPDQFHGFERRICGDVGGYLSPEIRGHGWNRTNGMTKYAVEVCGYGRAGFEVYDDRVTDRACEFIARRESGARPYCLVVGHVLPHNPLICERALFEAYLAALPVPGPMSEEALSRLHPAVRLWRARRGVDDLTPEQNHRALAAYYGLVTQMDRNVGRVLDAVRASPAVENTVVMYCSDHGDMACQHGMWWKGCHYEGAVRVPLIVSWPARLRGGRTEKSVVSLLDIGPTVLDLTRSEPLPGVIGKSLASLLSLEGEVAGWPNTVWSEYIGSFGDQPSCMIRSGRWKLIYYSETDSFQLFDLERDPLEMDDRAHDPSCRSVARDLLDQIHGRWSAQRMLDGWDREQRARDLIARCGHAPRPHAVELEHPPSDANQFDFAQVPGWDEIRKRLER